jgi:predicted acetyltransferase
MFTNDCYSYRQLPTIYKWQILSFMKVEWPFIFSGQDQFSEDTYPEKNEPVHFIISNGNSLVSHAEVIEINIIHSNVECLCYGLGNVFTFPPYRGKGYGQEAVKAATTYISKSNVDVAILFCDPSRMKFYEHSGWKGIIDVKTFIGTPKKYHEHKVLRMMLFISDKGKAGYSSFVSQPMFIEEPW